MLTRETVTEQEEDIMEWIICSNLKPYLEWEEAEELTCKLF